MIGYDKKWVSVVALDPGPLCYSLVTYNLLFTLYYCADFENMC